MIEDTANIFKDKSILIVEDDFSSYMVLKGYLRKTGANLTHVLDGQKAIDYVEANQDIDLILMDILMPLVDGYEATRRIKQIRNDLPIVSQTAKALDGDRQQSLNAGCDDYIAKPIQREKLISIVKCQLQIA